MYISQWHRVWLQAPSCNRSGQIESPLRRGWGRAEWGVGAAFPAFPFLVLGTLIGQCKLCRSRNNYQSSLCSCASNRSHNHYWQMHGGMLYSEPSDTRKWLTIWEWMQGFSLTDICDTVSGSVASYALLGWVRLRIYGVLEPVGLLVINDSTIQDTELVSSYLFLFRDFKPFRGRIESPSTIPKRLEAKLRSPQAISSYLITEYCSKSIFTSLDFEAWFLPYFVSTKALIQHRQPYTGFTDTKRSRMLLNVSPHDADSRPPSNRQWSTPAHMFLKLLEPRGN